MDGKQFDRITKTLRNGASRRRMLGGLSAVAAGLLAGRTVPAEARPVSSGCSKAGRACTGTGSGTCCGGEKLRCSPQGGISPQCNDGQPFPSGQSKCCAQVGTACQGHCECCSPGPSGGPTACKQGRCAEAEV